MQLAFGRYGSRTRFFSNPKTSSLRHFCRFRCDNLPNRNNLDSNQRNSCLFNALAGRHFRPLNHCSKCGVASSDFINSCLMKAYCYHTCSLFQSLRPLSYSNKSIIYCRLYMTSLSKTLSGWLFVESIHWNIVPSGPIRNRTGMKSLQSSHNNRYIISP